MYNINVALKINAYYVSEQEAKDSIEQKLYETFYVNDQDNEIADHSIEKMECKYVMPLPKGFYDLATTANVEPEKLAEAITIIAKINNKVGNDWHETLKHL